MVYLQVPPQVIRASVRLECWSTVPPASDAQWSGAEDVEVELPGGGLALETIDRGAERSPLGPALVRVVPDAMAMDIQSREWAFHLSLGGTQGTFAHAGGPKRNWAEQISTAWSRSGAQPPVKRLGETWLRARAKSCPVNVPMCSGN
ncbi:hypothetical protein ABZ192_36250 [Streptomyces sp. NPDC006235]|uniref:hypothetical protein n=1 Tax=Streptomyces sp. NPDC006235 TaxID=3156736 RepID=UPI0033AD5A93